MSGTIHLTMPLSAFAGGSEPGQVAGHGPVDAATSRDLVAMLAQSAATRWCVTVTGPDGRAAGHACARRGPGADEPVIRWAAGLRNKVELLETWPCGHSRQSTGYVPPRSLRHLIEVRQRTCDYPGCRRPAAVCDLDHTLPYDRGGRTCECNLGPRCRRHHRAKQVPGWHLSQDKPGIVTWRLPSGRTYTTRPEPYLG
ncbi:MAG TPA: HNH endonuclease signature motif containing protein [Streptosporangiaceae bacterium]|nr:HNH endonuclease signature motif containing protein [Streptosporangiaceae bacterium]